MASTSFKDRISQGGQQPAANAFQADRLAPLPTIRVSRQPSAPLPNRPSSRRSSLPRPVGPPSASPGQQRIDMLFTELMREVTGAPVEGSSDPVFSMNHADVRSGPQPSDSQPAHAYNTSFSDDDSQAPEKSRPLPSIPATVHLLPPAGRADSGRSSMRARATRAFPDMHPSMRDPQSALQASKLLCIVQQQLIHLLGLEMRAATYPERTGSSQSDPLFHSVRMIGQLIKDADNWKHARVRPAEFCAAMIDRQLEILDREDHLLRIAGQGGNARARHHGDVLRDDAADRPRVREWQNTYDLGSLLAGRSLEAFYDLHANALRYSMGPRAGQPVDDRVVLPVLLRKLHPIFRDGLKRFNIVTRDDLLLAWVQLWEQESFQRKILQGLREMKREVSPEHVRVRRGPPEMRLRDKMLALMGCYQ